MSSKALLPRLAVQTPLVVVLGAVAGASMFLMLTYGPVSLYTPLVTVRSRSDLGGVRSIEGRGGRGVGQRIGVERGARVRIEHKAGAVDAGGQHGGRAAASQRLSRHLLRSRRWRSCGRALAAARCWRAAMLRSPPLLVRGSEVEYESIRLPSCAFRYCTKPPVGICASIMTLRASCTPSLVGTQTRSVAGTATSGCCTFMLFQPLSSACSLRDLGLVEQLVDGVTRSTSSYNSAQITRDQALDKGWNNMKVQHPLVAVPKTELVWVPTKDGVQLARKVTIEAQMPTGGFVQYLNAHDGSLLDSYSTSLPRTNKGGERSIARAPMQPAGRSTARAPPKARCKATLADR